MALVSGTKSNDLNKMNTYVSLCRSGLGRPRLEQDSRVLGALAPGCTDKMEPPCLCSSQWGEGVLAEGEGWARRLEGHNQGVVSITSAHILLFTRVSASQWSCEGAGKGGLCPGSQVPS